MSEEMDTAGTLINAVDEDEDALRPLPPLSAMTY